MTISPGITAQGVWLGEGAEGIRRKLIQHHEPQPLLRHFAALAGEAVPFNTLEFNHARPEISCAIPLGRDTPDGGHISTHAIAQGTLRFIRSHAYTDAERQQLALCSAVLQQPLQRVLARHHSRSQEMDMMLETGSPPLHLEELISNGELDAAIGNGQLTLHYQPKVEMQSGQLTGLEALLRWHHGVHGTISPESFIPIAERHGIIRAVTRWVLATVLRQCASWQAEGLLVPVAVNLSGLDLEDPELPDYVADLLERWGVSPANIELEITETAVITEHKVSREVLDRLARLGVSVAIDDFGIGYSSLQRLKQLPFNTIKIDKSFVLDTSSDGPEMVFVDTITQLGHRLGMKVVAEGVECSESWRRLAAVGCDIGQGYHISRPLPSEMMTGWLRSSAQHEWKNIG